MKSAILDVRESQGEQLRSPQAVVIVMQQEARESRECLWVLHLDNGNQLLEKEQVLIGVVTHSLVRPREILRKAVTNGAAKIITVHSHPNGKVELSLEDIQIWRTLDIATDALGILILDHLVTSPIGGHISCRQTIARPYTKEERSYGPKEETRGREHVGRIALRQARSG